MKKFLLIAFLCLPATLVWGQEPTLEAPNVFTPNGDGINDVFTLKINGFAEVDCAIYSRWGEQMYRFLGVNGFWDGRTQAGIECADGVYVYLITAITENGETRTYQGSVHLKSQ